MSKQSNSLAAGLAQEMTDSITRVLELMADLSDEQLLGPRLKIVNPGLWEVGHVAWFFEFWTLRNLYEAEPLISNADQLYDSAQVAHDIRWELALPSREKTLGYVKEMLERSAQRLDSSQPGARDEYFFRLGTYHADMHGEALTYTRQTLGYSPPRLTVPDSPLAAAPVIGAFEPHDVEVPGGTFLLGAAPDTLFVFDNEKWAHPVEMAAFRIAATPVTNGQLLAFVEDGGYLRREFWTDEGWQWRTEEGAEHPVYWNREADGRWLQRRYDRFIPLEESHPVIHVSWYEAMAFCAWAGRRLPTEAEWEMAASAEPTSDGRGITGRQRRFPWGDEPPSPERSNLDSAAGGCVDVRALPDGDSAFGCRQMIGNVWEWVRDDFWPYPGYVRDPYKEYSEPWFGSHKVLRGGCWATRSRLIRNTWRNFYPPDRCDVWAGFRTCAL